MPFKRKRRFSRPRRRRFVSRRRSNAPRRIGFRGF